MTRFGRPQSERKPTNVKSGVDPCRGRRHRRQYLRLPTLAAASGTANTGSADGHSGTGPGRVPRRRDQPARSATVDRDVGRGAGVGASQPAAEPGYPARADAAGPGIRRPALGSPARRLEPGARDRFNVYGQAALLGPGDPVSYCRAIDTERHLTSITCLAI